MAKPDNFFMATPASLFPPEPLKMQLKDGKIFSPVRRKWLMQTPEEPMRQQYLLTLANEYGYAPNQLKEEQSLVELWRNHIFADTYQRLILHDAI